MKKRLLSMLLVVAMAATMVVGCGSDSKPADAPASSKTESAAPAGGGSGKLEAFTADEDAPVKPTRSEERRVGKECH